jgi:RES domain-containing protein
MIRFMTRPYRDLVKALPGCAIEGQWLLVSLLNGQPMGTNLMRSDPLRGGRFHPPRTFAAMYLAEDTEKCRSHAVFWAADESTRIPVLTVLRVQLTRVLDLSDRAVRKALGITSADLARSEDMSVSRAIGVAAYQSGFEGILYERPLGKGARNLVVFPHHANASGVKVLEIQLAGSAA